MCRKGRQAWKKHKKGHKRQKGRHWQVGRQ